MLYDRDYNLGLTQQELDEYEEITGQKYYEQPHAQKGTFGIVNKWYEYPIAARMYRTLFPNYCLDNVQLTNDFTIEQKNKDYLIFLESCKNEREVLNHIKDNRSYHIIGSLLRAMSLRVGHHGTFLFPEFQLGNMYKADYLLAGKGSGGYEFLLVELESPYGNITLKNGDLGSEFRDGISQIKDWRRWLPQNYNSFSDTMKKYKHPNMTLPDEFYTLDQSRFHYAVVAGRRTDFTDLTYTIARETQISDNIALFHYDNLYDFANSLIGKYTY